MVLDAVYIRNLIYIKKIEKSKKNILPSDGSGTKNPGTGRIRVVLFRVLGGPGTRMNRTGRIRVKEFGYQAGTG